MADDEAPEGGDQTICAQPDAVDPDDCATLVTREVAVTELTPAPIPTDQALELRIETIDRIIDALKK